MKVLVAVDGSKESRLALELASQLPLKGRHFILAHVNRYIDFDRPEMSYASRESLDTYNQEMEKASQLLLEEAQAFCVQNNISCETVALSGDPAEELIKQATELNPDMLVLGSRGLNPAKKLILGSVCDRLIRECHQSILIYRASLPEKMAHPEGKLRLLLAYDGTENSEKAWGALETWSGLDSIELVHCVKIHHTYGLNESVIALELLPRHKEIMEEKMTQLAKTHPDCPKVSAKILDLVWDVPQEINDYANQTHKDLIVVGSHGRGPLGRLFLGSVSSGLLNRVDHPLLIVR
jgi:nucleotide-binding universal stress UspA family protein